MTWSIDVVLAFLERICYIQNFTKRTRSQICVFPFSNLGNWITFGLLRLRCLYYIWTTLLIRRVTREGIFCLPPENFKILHCNLDICRNFQTIKTEFYILIIFKKSYWNFSLYYWLIISLQDLSRDKPSDRKFHKLLVF